MSEPSLPAGAPRRARRVIGRRAPQQATSTLGGGMFLWLVACGYESYYPQVNVGSWQPVVDCGIDAAPGQAEVTLVQGFLPVVSVSAIDAGCQTIYLGDAALDTPTVFLANWGDNLVLRDDVGQVLDQWWVPEAPTVTWETP